MSAGTLQAAGMRFVLRGTNWNWVHRLEMLPTDLDCTDMDDEQFEAEVRRVQGVFFAPLAVAQASSAKATGSAA